MKISVAFFVFVFGALMILPAITPTLATTTELGLPHSLHPIKGGSFTSLNWAGYAVTGSKGSVTAVSGSWIVPAVTGGVANQYAAFWVGIDGFTSNTVEQTGTMSYTDSNGNPTYIAWYEFYPNPSVTVTNVKPNDVISASVTYANGVFKVTLTDNGVTIVSAQQTSKRAARSSAEWIAEAPSSSGGVLPLANFSTVDFGQQYTLIPSTCRATIGGTTAPIGSFGSSVQTITMDTSGGIIKAQPTSLTGTGGTSFTVNWYHP